MDIRISCQVCSCRFGNVSFFKKHVCSKYHQQVSRQIFPKENLLYEGLIPIISFMDPHRKGFSEPFVGVSMISLCFSPGPPSGFYLCHVCETKCSLKNIFGHVHSEEHCFNYFVYTNPDDVSFSWRPGMDIRSVLRSKLKSEVKKTELNYLQALHLPLQLLKNLMDSTYTEVMQALAEKDKLVEQFEAIQKNRTDLQDYHSSSNRKHPLLGLQHIVECVCAKPGEKRYYLCTLCCLVFANHMIIKHVLSLDHIHCYFKAVHPSTLLSKEAYRDYSSFAHIIHDLSEQAEEIQAAEKVSMKQVLLEPSDFKAVNFKSYAEALKSMENITKSSLTVSIKPGIKLEHQPKKQDTAPSTQRVRCSLSCQNCSYKCTNFHKFFNHLSWEEHAMNMEEPIVAAGRNDDYEQSGQFFLGIFPYALSCLKANRPIVGTSLVVTCIASQTKAKPFYLCFACLMSFPQSELGDHFDSKKHIINTQLCQNPWKLPFAWEANLDYTALKATTWKEEVEQSRDTITLKVFDVPHSIFFSVDHSNFLEVWERLEPHRSVIIQNVPQAETYSQLPQHERFPLLGKQHLVTHNLVVSENKQVMGSLCLLCERRLTGNEMDAHIFSREHVSKFLDAFHPGSLSSSRTDAETLLDLAKQAARVHPQSDVQNFYLDEPIKEPCDYKIAKKILAAVKRRRREGSLVPQIKSKYRLVSRISPKNTNKQQETDARTKSPDTDAKESGGSEDKHGSDKETPSGETEGAAEKEGSPKTSPKDFKKEPEAELPAKLKTEEPVDEKPKEEAAQSHENAEKNDDPPIKQEKSSSIKQETTLLKESPQKNEIKRSSTPEKTLNNAGQNGSIMSPKTLQPVFKQESCFEEITDKSNICSAVKNTETSDGEVPDKDVMERVSRTCIECRCSKHEAIYLCGHCLLKIPKKDINNHGKGADHPKMSVLVRVVHLEEAMYNQISKQVFLSASLRDFLYKVIQKSQEPNLLFQTAAQAHVKPNRVSKKPSCKQEVKKVVCVSEESGVSPDTSKTAGAICKMDQGKPKTCTPVVRSDKAGKHHSSSSPQSTQNKCKPDLSGKKAAKSEVGGDLPNTFNCTTTSNRPSEITSPTTSIPPSSKSFTPSDENRTLQVSSDTRSAATHKPEHPPKCANTESKAPPSPDLKKTSSAASNAAKPQIKSINTGQSMKASIGRNPDNETAVRKRKLATVPHQNPEEIKKPQKESNLPKVGLNQLVLVSCEKKQQVYCLLCSDKLNSSSAYHLTSRVHQFKYVKMKYPEWSVKELEKQLIQTVTLLAEVEKKLPQTRSIQRLEVKKDEYQKLGNLPDNLAVEKVKALVKQRDLQASSSPTVDSTLHPCQDISSPCDVSSSGIPAFHDDMSDSADHNQPQHQRQEEMTEMEYNHEDDPAVAGGHSVRGSSSDEEDIQVDEEIEEEAETLMETDPDQWTQAEDMADIAQEEQFSDAKSPPHVEVTTALQTSESETILKSTEKSCSTELLRRQSIEAASLIQDQPQLMSCSRFNQEPVLGSKDEDEAETLQLHQLKEQNNNQPQKITVTVDDPEAKVDIGSKSGDHLHWERDAASQKTQNPAEPAEVLPVKVSSQREVVAGQQNQSELSHNAEPPPKRHKLCEDNSALQTHSITSFGNKVQGSSRLSLFLTACGQDLEQVIGRDYVWECQGISLKTFYLCEVCEKTLSTHDICQHMVSRDHQLQHLRREHQRCLEMFWLQDDLPPEFKAGLLKDIVRELSKRERFLKVDAQSVLLRPEFHESLRTAPFTEALKIVKSIANEDKQAAFHRPASAFPKSERHQTRQQTADLQSIQKNLPTERLSAQVLEKKQRSETAGLNPEKNNSEEGSLADGSSKPDHEVFKDQIVGLEPCSSAAQKPECITTVSPLIKQSPVEEKSSNSKVCRGLDPSEELCSSSLHPHTKPSVSQIEESFTPMDLNATFSKGDVHPSPEALPLRERDYSDGSLQPELTVTVPQLQSSDPLPVSSAINPQVSIPDELPHTVGRQLEVSMNTLLETSSSISAECTAAPMTCDSGSSLQSAAVYTSSNPVTGEVALLGTRKWEFLSGLIGVLKRNNYGPSTSKTADRDFMKASSPLGASECNAVVPNAGFGELQRSQINVSQETCRIVNNPEPMETGISQLPINTIITARSDHMRQTSRGHTLTEVNRRHQLHFHSDLTPSPPNFMAVSGGNNPHTQAAFLPGLPDSAPPQSPFPLNAFSIYQQYIYPSQQVVHPVSMHSFGYSLTAQMPPSSGNMEMQQYYSMMRPESDQ
ncbi:uncharacterized protein LOC119785944 isoform X3 [Cyprinodon tularosa]|uniref:uncharacterized protein LOC119785944 isoform X3 n=1 Tax=Cyprinodon tularosa TaxID=77115 RepID=UPI0018E1F19E|nr:uncharacterized protein LOC119785944 isoform X3 [Cyprinodon tularosa]